MLDSLLHPKSIAIVGVSLEPQKVGHQVFANLLSFPGKIYPINPKHKKISGHVCYPDVLSIPEHIDLVIIATPVPTVEDVVHQCVDKKVKAIIIITAGFAENGKAGKKLQDRIATTLKNNGIALLGPNTLGAINPYEDLNASFAPAHIDKGSIALISQSGAMLTTIFSQFASRKIGCSFALSLGNGAGITVNDALSYAMKDPKTKVIALYLESLPDLQHFFYLTKEISQTKPIFLLKGGVTDQGQHASLSHTAALATDSTLLREAQHQFGYTMVDTIEQFIETTFFADKLKELPLSLMILTNAGGPGVNSIDLASNAGIRLASWTPATIQRFAASLPRVIPHNPTDLLGDASVADIETALAFANEDPLIDSILLIITPQAVTDIPGMVKMLIEKQKNNRKPLVVALMTGEEYRRELVKLRTAGITAVEYANEGVEIYAYLSHARASAHTDRSATLMKTLAHNLTVNPSLPKGLETRRSFPLTENELSQVYLLLEAYGCTLPRAAIVSNRKQLDDLDALDPARVYPLIAKTANLTLKHKAILGAVIKDIQNKDQAVQAFEKLQKFGNQVVFQEVIEDAIEVIIGVRRDLIYGPFIAIGTGGSLTNIIADRAYIFLPASGREIRTAFKRTKLFTLLTSAQREEVLTVLEQCQSLFEEHSEIFELEINPLMVTKEKSYVADIKVQMQSKEERV
ncbi:MAG: acetate--CoA ligase family protein [Candidatus Woesebacteria bacterium]